ncbi:hypothetical protein S245_056675 [Arachis hypogaea]
MKNEISKPKGTSFFEKRDQSAIDMAGHDPVHGTNKLSTDKDNGDDGRGTQEPDEGPLEIFSKRVLVKLMDGGINSHAAEEALDGVAHATAAYAEYHHRVLRRQPLYPLQRVHSHTHHSVVPACCYIVPPRGRLVVHYHNVTS